MHQVCAMTAVENVVVDACKSLTRDSWGPRIEKGTLTHILS